VAALDGLRAFAVAAVLVFHADLGIVDGGFLGVSVFFTLSGFLITSLLLREHERHGRIALGAFYTRRARRLLPAAYLCVALVLAIGVLWSATQRRDLPGDAVAAVANVANWRFAFAEQSYQDLFLGAPSPLAHFWSLAIEEQCYLVIPVIAWWALRAGGRRRLLVVLVALAAGSVLATWLTNDIDLIYNGTHTRAAEVLLGALAAVLVVRSRPSRRWSLVMAASGVVTLVVLMMSTSLASDWLYRGGFVVVAVVSAVTVVGLQGEHLLARVFGAPPLAMIGRTSYGIYLYHWPVFLVLTADRVGFGGVALLAVRVAVTALLVAVSYRWVEWPVRRGTALPTRRRLAMVMGCSAAALVAGSLVVVPAPQFSATEQLLALGSDGPVTFDAPTSTGAPPSTTVAPTVLVLGSSNAPVPPLRAAGLHVVDGVQPGCPIASGAEARRRDGTVTDVGWCEPTVDRWKRLLASTPIDVVVVTASEVDAGLVRTADDAALPATDDVAGTFPLLTAAEDRMREAFGVIDASRLPVVYFDEKASGARAERMFARLALESSPPRMIQGDVAGVVAAVRAEVGGSVAATDRPMKVLVVGDSTSLDVAQALSDGGDGRVEVQWAGTNGCPLVRAAATRPSSGAEWVVSTCPDFEVALPPILARFQPDKVLVVLGPTELQQHRYHGGPTAHVAGDAVFEQFHDEEMAAFLAVVGDIPVVVADAPPISSGQWASREMADPDRLAKWNAQVARWDAAWPQVTVLPYAAALAAHEAEHGDIRIDGVHPDVGPLTTIARETLVPFLVSPTRILVIGDSTSLIVATALSDGAEGRLAVQWAGQEGCPLVRAVAVRPSPELPWRLMECDDLHTSLRAALDSFRPDAVLVVVGAMELMEQRYPNDSADADGHLPGSPAYASFHDQEIDALVALVRDGGLPLVVADTPPLGVGSFSTFEMADPERAAAFNRELARWDDRHPELVTLRYAQPLLAYEAQHGLIRTDGSHPEVGALTEIARTDLVPALIELVHP